MRKDKTERIFSAASSREDTYFGPQGQNTSTKRKRVSKQIGRKTHSLARRACIAMSHRMKKLATEITGNSLTSFPRSAWERNVQTLCVDSLTAERLSSMFPRESVGTRAGGNKAERTFCRIIRYQVQ